MKMEDGIEGVQRHRRSGCLHILDENERNGLHVLSLTTTSLPIVEILSRLPCLSYTLLTCINFSN